jgi:hypothetical protein
VPQDTSRVLENPNERRDLHFIVLDSRPILSACRIWRIQLSQIDETCETPITLFGDESVMGIYKGVSRVPAVELDGLTGGSLDGGI